MEAFKSFRARLAERLSTEDDVITRTLGKAERATGINRVNILIGAVVLLFFTFLWQHGIQLLTVVATFPYPAYRSIKAVESARKDDDTQWLIYWIVFSVFHLAEYFSDILLYWFPFYYTAKLVFLGWCMWPSDTRNGSAMIYNLILRPLFISNEKKIDEAFDRVSAKAAEYHAEASSQAASQAARHLTK